MFRIRLISPERIALPANLYEQLEDPEYYQYLAMTGSRLLEEVGYQFEMNGFGREWNMDVGYDMSTIVESLPDFIQNFHFGGTGEIDIYSQGLECTLVFLRAADMVRIACISRTKWTPDPAFEVCTLEDLKEMLAGFATDFAHGLHRLSSPIAQLEPFRSWLTGGVWETL
ncbi:hypothetical protein [Nonomuraea dietziae]|uniref:hypothetical protein n=1 Tax=Nonomuraea dietziae TaxID=65515 RepID=UPI0034215DD8